MADYDYDQDQAGKNVVATDVAGEVKKVIADKGFGFIGVNHEAVETGKDVFFHVTELQEGMALEEGDSVVIDIEETRKGLNALNVRLPGEESEEVAADEAEVDETDEVEETEEDSEEQDEVAEVEE